MAVGEGLRLAPAPYPQGLDLSCFCLDSGPLLPSGEMMVCTRPLDHWWGAGRWEPSSTKLSLHPAWQGTL